MTGTPPEAVHKGKTVLMHGVLADSLQQKLYYSIVSLQGSTGSGGMAGSKPSLATFFFNHKEKQVY